jgi:excisionase family DNA binding protein
MNIDQAAKTLCVKPQTVRNLIASGQLKARRRGPEHAFDVDLSPEHRLTVRALAECMHCSPRWVQRLIKERRAIRANRVGRVYRISVSELKAVMEIRMM